MTSSEINNGGRNEEGGYFAGTAIQQVCMFALYDIEPANARSDMNADSGGILRCNLQTGHLYRLIRCRQRQVNETAHFLDFFFFDEV